MCKGDRSQPLRHIKTIYNHATLRKGKTSEPPPSLSVRRAQAKRHGHMYVEGKIGLRDLLTYL